MKALIAIRIAPLCLWLVAGHTRTAAGAVRDAGGVYDQRLVGVKRLRRVWGFVWPIILVGVGALILVGAARRR